MSRRSRPPARTVGRASVAASHRTVVDDPDGRAHPAALNLATVGTVRTPENHWFAGAVLPEVSRDPSAERPSRLAGIVASGPPRSRPAPRRTNLLVVGLVGLIAAAGLTGGATVLVSHTSGLGTGTPLWSAPPVTPTAPGPDATPSATAAPVEGAGGGTVSLSATGDIIMGAAPDGLPPRGARDFFTGVKAALQADLQMGNLEQPLTNDTGVTKCPPPQAPAPGPSPSSAPAPPKQTCFAFRSPPGYAEVLRNAGFKVLNLANNHAYDFGAEGNRQTRSALEAAGLVHTGAPGQIAVVEAKGIKIAVVGFSSYPWSQSVVDIDAGVALVKRAKDRADLVVVHMHVGAEGADKTHVRPGTEMFLGENRGDPLKFAHAVVDAGADLVIGHGPHVMRAMEFYRGRLIAYSLGNFAGYKALNFNGLPGVGGVLKVTLRKDGSYVDGALVPTRMVAPGLPAPDPTKQALSLVRSLSDADLPSSGARIGDDGAITPRT